MQDILQDNQCRAISGTWFSEYDGKTVESAPAASTSTTSSR
ncbi:MULTISPECIES: hypothetical protein [unclassified Streptomyces]